MHEVIVVGSGPTGLMLAGELALAGVDVVILERRPVQELMGTRARGFHARTIELLDQREQPPSVPGAAGRVVRVAGPEDARGRSGEEVLLPAEDVLAPDLQPQLVQAGRPAITCA